MSLQGFPLAYALITSCCLIGYPAVADCARDTLATAGNAGESLGVAPQPSISVGAPQEDEAIARVQLRSQSGDPDAMNNLGILYARGRGVTKSYAMAVKWFRESALQGYAPAMVNLGTMYQLGAGAHRNYRRAYAWLRVALAFGVPEEDHDATVFRLGTIAARMGSGDAVRAERLAADIADKIAGKCKKSADQFADLAYPNGRR
jgi:TPR repeat protein